jgi:hypothetical protein
MLYVFLRSLSPNSRRAAVAELVEGNVVELALAYMVQAGVNVHQHVPLSLLPLLLDDAVGRERILAHTNVSQLIKAVANLLLEVRDVVLIGRVSKTLSRGAEHVAGPLK